MNKYTQFNKDKVHTKVIIPYKDDKISLKWLERTTKTAYNKDILETTDIQ